jgi:FemAB-related protein (PEP-CTERM system-associated)
MTLIRQASSNDETAWNTYILHHGNAGIYHHFAFNKIIGESFNREPFYLIAEDAVSKNITGILPLIYFKGPLADRSLVSLPFFDGGGLCADTREAGIALIEEAARLYVQLKCKYVELHQDGILPFDLPAIAPGNMRVTESTSKVRMVLELPGDADSLFKSFPAKLRSQIRKPQKEGCTVTSGGSELIDDFYKILKVNMRDLGSPVEPVKTFHSVMQQYPDMSKIFIVYLEKIPVACGLIFGYGKRVVNRWASMNRAFKKAAPNMLLYWKMLEFAIENGYTLFDFGRSSVGETTYKFKEQWGAKPFPLHWYRYSSESGGANEDSENAEGTKKKLFKAVWQKLPVPVATFFGARLRRHVPL